MSSATLPPQMAKVRFEGASALVTGGATGIGFALVEALLARGTRVTMVGRREGRLEEAAERLGRPSTLTHASCDVTDAAAVKTVVDGLVAREGVIDLLFNNAGVGMAGEVKDADLADWERMWRVNVMGVVHGIHAAYPHMIERGSGHIVNVGSSAGLVPQAGMAHYVAAKHAVTGLSGALRTEARRYGVRVTVVCPGPVKTEILEQSAYRGLDGDKIRQAAGAVGMSARECARQVLAAVERDAYIAPITALARVGFALHRLSPELARRVNALRFLAMRRVGGS